jgi:ribosomal subunit interface protein
LGCIAERWREDPEMKLQITGRNFDVGEALRDHIADRARQVSEKYFAVPISGQVTLVREAGQIKADCLVHVGSGIDMKAEDRAGDAQSAVDGALEKLEKRLRRYKRRLRDHHASRGEVASDLPAADYVIRPPAEDEAEPEDGSPVIVAEATQAIPELAVGEAVMLLDIAERPFLLFRNGGHGRLNVVYRRDDGNIGWIDPDLVPR